MKINHHLVTQSFALAIAAGAALVFTPSLQAAAFRDHGHHGGGGGHSNVRLGIGFSTHGSGFSLGFGNGWNGRSYGSTYCGPRYSYGYSYGGYYRSYAPIVVASPYYGYYGSSYGYDSPPTVVVAQPTVITQPAVVTQPVVVQQPVMTVASEPAPAVTYSYAAPQTAPATMAVPAQTTTPQDAEQNRYRDRELGDAYMRMHDPDNAARVYKRYLAAWNGDGTVTRNYGLAQIARGESQEGFRNFVQGYKLESDLIKRPIRMDDLGGKIGFERILDAAATGAAGSNSAEGWATVALLQHTSGNHDAAVSALQKARDGGLDQTTLDQFTLEIGKPTR